MKRATAKLELGVLVFLLCGFVAAACGRTNDDESGETHFLAYCTDSCGDGYDCLCGVCTKACDTGAACSAEGAAASCVAPRGACATAMICDAACTADADCAALGSDHRCVDGACRAGTPPSTGLVCAAGCQAVIGYPQDSERQCADLSRGEEIACQCGAPVAISRCWRRVADGTLWVMPDGEMQDGSFERCSLDEGASVLVACDFADCDNRPNSVCSRDETCSALGCGSLQFEDTGCARPSCTTDDQCAGDERCVPGSVNTGFCSYSSEGTCNCAALGVAVEGAFCNPVTEVGPRGEWQRIEIDRGAGPCAPDMICQWVWTVEADGSVSTFKEGVTAEAQLTADDLTELRRLIDGPELRPGLRDGLGCDPPPTDVGVVMRLVLPDTTLEQSVTGCVTTGPAGNAAGQVYTLLQKY